MILDKTEIKENIIEIKTYQILCKINNFASFYLPTTSLSLRSACLSPISSCTLAPYIPQGPISFSCIFIREFVPYSHSPY